MPNESMEESSDDEREFTSDPALPEESGTPTSWFEVAPGTPEPTDDDEASDIGTNEEEHEDDGQDEAPGEDEDEVDRGESPNDSAVTTMADASAIERPSGDEEPVPLDPVLGQVVPQLRSYARELSPRAPGLAAAVDDYAGRVEGAARGDLPAGAARAPEGLSPEAVAREITTGRLATVLELMRNVLIFLPVLWTWFEIGRATAAYSALIDSLPEDAPQRGSFLHLWQTGFGGEGGAFTFTLSQTAWVAAGLILALVVVHLWATFERTRNNRAIERRTADFGALLTRAAGVQRPSTLETPEDQLDEFARAGLSLARQLADLSLTFGQRTAPLAESLVAAERAMADMAGLVRQQSAQMAEVTQSLGEVAAISRRLEAVEASMERSSKALEQMQDRLAPAADELVTAIAEFSSTAASVERATDNFAASLEGSHDQGEALREAAVQLNNVGNRFLDNLGR